MERIAALEKQLPQRKKPPRQEQSKVLKESEPDANEDPFASYDPQDPGAESSTQSHRSPTRASFASFSSKSASITPGSSLASLQKPSKSKYDKSSKKTKPKPFNLEKEKPQLLETLASSSVASTNLMNALKLINREKKRVSEDHETVQRFEVCKMLRKQILRYIQHVESEQWLGSLIHANEELVTALMAFEVLDKSLEDDSDSENNEWDNEEPPTKDSPRQKSVHEAFAGLSIDKSPRKRPPMISLNGKERASDVEDDNDDDDDDAFSEDDNPDDPFGDSHAVHTPKGERPGMTW